MLHKTVDESDKQSISTKVGPTKAASFTSTSKRQMYRNKASSSIKKIQLQICNMIVLEPEYVSFLVHDDVFFLDSAQNFVVVSDFHYGVLNDRAKPVMIARNCQPGAELILASAKKPGMNIILYSIHRFTSPEYSTMLHFNITKYNPGQFDSPQARDIYLSYSQNQNPLYFVTVQNSKKGVLLSQIISPQGEKQYQILYINLLKTNKTKNPKHISMLKQNSLSFGQQEQKSQQNKQQKQFLYTTPQKTVQKIALKPHEKILKMINSQFGDSILIVTNLEIYQLDFESNAIYMKSLDFVQKLRKYLKNDQYQDDIQDICYITDGLKIIFLTQKGVLGFIEAQNIHYAQSVHQILANSNKKQQAALIRVDSLVGKISIETDKGSVLILKIGEKQVTFEKKIQLPVQANQISNYRVNFLPRHDEMILQRVTKQPKPTLQILCKNLLSPSNEFSPIYSSPLDQKSQKSASTNSNPIKIISSKANTITCYLKQNTISFYKFNSSISSSSHEQHPIQHLFSKTFFQKPLSISMDPYSSNMIILFKQFVKFYKFKYNDIVQYFTYDVRNVCYTGFTDNGQYIIIAVEDMLYFINSFTFETDKIVEMYGDIKSVRYYDNVMYVLLKNKVNKNISDTLILQTYAYEKQQYNKIHEIKIQPNQAVLTDHTFFMIASKKQIQVYRKKIQYYQQPSPKQKYPKIPNPTEIEQISTKSIKFNESTEYPTCLTLCQELGIILVGTNCGRVYEYLWPFIGEDEFQNFYMVNCSTSEISRILVSATLEKIYVYCKNTSIMQMDLIQYVEGQQMPNIYVINPKTLYESDILKYQFVNRQYLYPNSTSYIFEDIRQTNQNIEQLKFILEKTKDDIEQFVTKKTESFQNQIKDINQEKSAQVRHIKEEINKNQKRYHEDISLLKELLIQNQSRYQEQAKVQKDKYQKKLLQLYKQASELRQIYAELQKQQRKQKDLYLIQNDNMIKKLKEEGLQTEEQYKQRYQEIKQKTDIFHNLQKDQMSKRIDEELHIFNQIIRNNVEDEVNMQEQRKQSLLGARGYLMKEITNYKQRRDEFESLIMETNVQIEELYADQESYKQKRAYLMTELTKKEKIIEEKQRQLMSLIDSTASMKKLKQTHEFQLTEYEKQFEPIISKMTVIDGKVQKMNSEILREYLKKVEKDKQIMDNAQKFQKLKRYKQKKIKIKLDTYTKLQRFLAELQYLLQNPLDRKLQQNLNALSNGQKFQIDQQQVKQKIQNAKLMRRKTFIGKQIEQHEKRQSQVIRNKNDINRHYNENTMLVRQFNNLKQLNRKFQQLLKQTELKYMAAKATRLETPRKKTNSMMDLKKISEKKLTPFQKHQMQYNDMFNKGLTTQTKLSKTGQSMSLLKTLIKDVQLTDSRYQKMEIVRDRIKSFVNPQIRIRKTLASQRALFDRKKIDSEAEM